MQGNQEITHFRVKYVDLSARSYLHGSCLKEQHPDAEAKGDRGAGGSLLPPGCSKALT